jgi:hypothetical protein
MVGQQIGWGLIEAPTRHLSGEPEENHKKHQSGYPVSRRLPNASTERYRYASLLGPVSFRSPRISHEVM